MYMYMSLHRCIETDSIILESIPMERDEGEGERENSIKLLIRK